MQVTLGEIEATAKAALMKHGAEEWIAGEVAAAVREAEGLGNRICGLYYLESYCQQLRTGRVKGDAVPEVRKPRPGWSRWMPGSALPRRRSRRRCRKR